MAYNPYKDIEKVYNAKVAWSNATNDEERKRQNEIATAARNNLKSYGYGDIATQVSADGASAATVKKIMDNWAKVSEPVTGTYKTGVNNPAYNQAITSASNKNDTYFDTVKSDHANVNSKYDSVFNYANSDITKSDEYKSAFDKIMPNYTLAAMQGRDNEVASGAASNSGNIDSFAAANAMRQQSALTAKGQQLAHQAGIDAVNARIQNARSILSDLGIYNSSVYSAMSDSVGNDRAIANDIFNNEQTALNNDVARKSEIASVSGYTPDEWTASNNPYLNDNGTIKDEYKDVDFAAVMANAKAAGNTNAYNAAAVARYYKIMGNYGAYGQYDDGNYIVPGLKQTEAAREFDEQIAASDRALSAETSMNTANNQNKIDQIKTSAEYGTTVNKSGTVAASKPTLTAAQATNAIKNGEISKSVIDAYNYYYGTSYTVTNPPKLNDTTKTGGVDLLTGNNNGNGGAATLTDAQVKAWVDKLNNALSKKYGSKFKAVESTGNGKYKSVPSAAEYTVMRVLESDELTDAQKQYLLIDKFGISADTINNMLKDPHYK